MVFCVVGRMPREISRDTWFVISGLEIEIEVAVIWENKKNLKIFTEKVDSVQFTLGEPYQDNTKKCLHEIKRKENDVCVSVSSDEGPED